MNKASGVLSQYSPEELQQFIEAMRVMEVR